ncbi:DUF3427 domain-containing protein [Marinobacter sp.]|uniref:DUF3427 domain-containing protein n=1 Tax=Marinobacter sp. TaxID=50741 RepID=UPI0035637A3C
MQQTGIYEQLITKLIQSRLDREKFYVGERQLSSAEASVWLSRFLSNILEFAIESVPTGENRLQEQIELSNQLLMWLKGQIQDDGFLEENLLDSQGKILTALYELENPVAADLKQYVEDIFPLTGLTQSELFSGSNAGLSLESELKREILSADKIYWLVSFIKWAGIRIFRKELEAFTASGRELKIITTSYMGATDARAVEYLASLPNTEVRLSYNTERERLHAKSYLFLRNSGYHTGYIGSSNLSRSALTNGLEWNLKITSQEIPHIINKSLSTFETYWASDEFERFDGQAESAEKLKRALKQQRGQDDAGALHFFDITPFPHQKDILEQLSVERDVHQRYRNLVVAATGTGKTLISAFDFHRFLKAKPDANFLFVAHREEILRQAREAYRGVFMKALAFCVSRDHANFMVQQLLFHGIKADVLTSDNSHERQQKQQAIRSGQINVLCVVDIFNEGIDIPEVDTLLFLRPTESLTIFLQQLGRGLRLADGKDCCTVMDFVGNSRPEYDFANKFRALLGKSERSITDELKQGFPHAPLGCRIELTKKTQEMVLSNIRQATLTMKRLVSLVRQFPQHSVQPLTLKNFLTHHPHINLNELYKRGSWSELVSKAKDENVADESPFKLARKAIYNRILMCDDHQYLLFLKKLCQAGFVLDQADNRLALMCHYDFWQKPGPELELESLSQSLAELNKLGVKQELSDVLDWKLAQTKHEQPSMPDLQQVPLRLHARYSREEILVGFGAMTFDHQPPSREGVFVMQDQKIELLFVTLNKNEKQFSPTTMYHDYAINEELFHWQSQNSARPDRGRGKDYIEHAAINKRLFLFVREQAKDEYGRTMGFVNYGEVDYVSHTGSQPMSITWKLRTPMPNFMWHQAAKLAVA